MLTSCKLHPIRAGTRRTGFTLVELLIVMSIIAVLISLLLPALNRARELTKLTICQSNLKQLMTAMIRYTQENNESYPYPSTTPLPEDWVYWEPGRALATGGIMKYIGMSNPTSILTCPSDNLEAHPGWPNNFYPFSYSININLSGWWPHGDAPNGYNPPYVFPTLRVGRVAHPSNCILLIEETEETLDDGCWAWQSQFGSGENILSSRHDQIDRELANDPSNSTAGRGNCAYCDGHVEYTKRADTWKPQFYDPTY